MATGVGTAFAQGPSNDSAVSNITESFGSLTIHKYKQTGPDGAAGNGLQAEITNGDPLDGVKFVIAKVKDDSVDLSTNAGWDAVGTFMTQHPNGEGTDGLLDEALEKTTADGGLAAFENLPIGLYLVKEQLTEEQKNQGIVGIDNFYVTVPMVNPNDSSSWNYDVHVYPKNTQHTVTKTVEDASVYKAGDAFNWTVSATLPASPVGINSYIIADKFDDNLEYKSTKVYIGETALTEGEDYNLQIEGQVVKVVLTTDTEGKGVKRFADNAGKQLRAYGKAEVFFDDKPYTGNYTIQWKKDAVDDETLSDASVDDGWVSSEDAIESANAVRVIFNDGLPFSVNSEDEGIGNYSLRFNQEVLPFESSLSGMIQDRLRATSDVWDINTWSAANRLLPVVNNEVNIPDTFKVAQDVENSPENAVADDATVVETPEKVDESTGVDDVESDGAASELGSLSGSTWVDADKDGRKDEGESPLKDVKVYLYQGSDNSNLVDTSVTDAAGSYSFEDLKPADNYRVLFEAPTVAMSDETINVDTFKSVSAYTLTEKSNDCLLDASVSCAEPRTQSISMLRVSGSERATANAGFVKLNPSMDVSEGQFINDRFESSVKVPYYKDTPIKAQMTNTGNETLSNIVFKNETVSGQPIKWGKCIVEGGPEIDLTGKNPPFTFEGIKLAVNDSLICDGIFEKMPSGGEHEDKVAFEATGEISGARIADESRFRATAIPRSFFPTIPSKLTSVKVDYGILKPNGDFDSDITVSDGEEITLTLRISNTGTTDFFFWDLDITTLSGTRIYESDKVCDTLPEKPYYNNNKNYIAAGSHWDCTIPLTITGMDIHVSKAKLKVYGISYLNQPSYDKRSFTSDTAQFRAVRNIDLPDTGSNMKVLLYVAGVATLVFTSLLLAFMWLKNRKEEEQE